MANQTLIPMMGQQIDTASPLQALANGMYKKQQLDAQVAREQEQNNYNRQQDALNRERQSKIDAANISSKALDDKLTRERILQEQIKSLDAREQSRIQSLSIAAASVKPFLDAGDVEGAKKFAQSRLGNLHNRMALGENIDDQDTAAFIDMLENGDVSTAKQYVDGMVYAGQLGGYLKMPKTGTGTTATIDPLSGEITYTAPPKQMPATALKMQNEALDAIGTANSIQADIGGLVRQLNNNDLVLGPISNVTSSIQNYSGLSDEKSRNYATFRNTLEKLRNDSLRLNKGVQTEGDAQRAWDELVTNINDKNLVSERLKEIMAINQRAADLKKLEVENTRANYNQPSIDYSKYDVAPAIGLPEQQSGTGLESLSNEDLLKALQ